MTTPDSSTNPAADAAPATFEPVWQTHRFDALKMRCESEVNLIRKLTDLDLKIFGGYLTISIAAAGWLSQRESISVFAIFAFAVMSFTLAASAAQLLHINYLRRREVVETLQRLDEAFGFDRPDTYIPGKALLSPTKFRAGRPIYLQCIVLSCFAQFVLLVSYLQRVAA